MNNQIEIKGAKVNNLKNIDIKLPRDKFIVITGVSGSGKSSLAFDTLYAEGQRRYVESLSSYARQFLGRMNKPECDYIKGLPPAIAIEQKVTTRNPRSTVGTSTEIYEYLRLLYSRIGHTFSPISGTEVKKHTPDDILNCVKGFANGTKFVLLTPLQIPEGRTLEEQLKASVIKGFSSRCDNQDDLFQIGVIGLIKAIENFNLEYNLQFSTYAVPMIIGEIKRYLRDNTQIRVSRQIKDLAYKALKEKENYLEQMGEEIKDFELAKRLNVGIEDLKLALESTSTITSLYDAVYNENDDEILLIDQLSDDLDLQVQIVNELTLKEAISSLNELQKRIINDRYYLSKTQFEIANEFNISQAQVSRIEKSAIDNIRSFFY
jgi:RNA polymerase sigma factor (sigma-70 family)